MNKQDLANTVFEKLSKGAFKTKFHKAENEPTYLNTFKYDHDGKSYTFLDSTKDPYIGLRSGDKSTVFEIVTDGQYEPEIKRLGLTTQEMIFYRVSNYNYIITKQFLKNNDVSEVFQTVILKDVEVKQRVDSMLNSVSIKNTF